MTLNTVQVIPTKHALPSFIFGLGAGVIKVPIVDPILPLAVLQAIADEAHRVGLKVAAHATSTKQPPPSPKLFPQTIFFFKGICAANMAAQAGADILAHAPTQALDANALSLWNQPGKAVVTTLATFGGVQTISSFRQTQATICASIANKFFPPEKKTPKKNPKKTQKTQKKQKKKQCSENPKRTRVCQCSVWD